MTITIPTIKRQEVEGKIKAVKSSLEVQVDTSFLAHLKWEEHFQKTAGYDLTTYTFMMEKLLKNPKKAKTELLSLLKLLYCYVSSDTLPTFKDFLRLFDYDVADEILNKIGTVLELVGKTASKN